MTSLQSRSSIDNLIRKIGHGGYLSGQASDGNNTINSSKVYQLGINTTARSTGGNDFFGVQAQCGPVAANRILLVEWFFEGIVWTTQNTELYFDTMLGEGRNNFTVAVGQTRLSWTYGYSPAPRGCIVLKTPQAFTDMWVGLGISGYSPGGANGSGSLRVANNAERQFASGIDVFDTGPA